MEQKRRTICTEGAVNLVRGLMRVARSDYILWYRTLLRNPGSVSARIHLAQLEHFFHSPRFRSITMDAADPDCLIRSLREQALEQRGRTS